MENKKQFLFGIFIFIFALVALVAIFWTIQSQTSKVTKKTAIPTPIVSQETPDMILSFNPNILNVSAGGNFTANIQLDTYGNPINSLTVAISYNPSEIDNIRLTPIKDPTSALSYAFNLIAGTQQNNPALGTITQTFNIPKSIPTPKGRGSIARITGKLKPGVKNTIIRFTSGTTTESTIMKRVILGKVNLKINASN